ncbi:MAG TPA: hypothetical protein VFC82_08605 [Actinomycetaceae bacterium]|nr:hypothetical protein [Actinomycetaceae bacterium]
MSADDQHAELIAAWEPLRDLMDKLPGLIRWDDVQHMDVTDMADRVRSLTSHLSGAVQLSSAFRYESALALIRTGLEQCVVDWLVFHGRTLVQHYSGVDEQRWQEWQEARAAGADWTTTIVDWSRTKRDDVRIVREGLYSEPDEDGNRKQISIYYFLLEQYRPSLGPPSVQTEDWSISKDELRRLAGENQALWNVYLKWSSLMENLRANALVDAVDAGRLAAHYRFLSSYAHPVVDHRRELYGRDALLGWPKYDHYSSELVVLYAITLGALEMRNFIRTLDQPPAPTLANADEVVQILAAAESATSYFWFLGAHLHAYDTWKARNEVAFGLLKEGLKGELPAEPAPDEVPYPADPLRRLVALHGSAQEMMTGLAYDSPWPRQDARWR